MTSCCYATANVEYKVGFKTIRQTLRDCTTQQETFFVEATRVTIQLLNQMYKVPYSQEIMAFRSEIYHY